MSPNIILLGKAFVYKPRQRISSHVPFIIATGIEIEISNIGVLAILGIKYITIAPTVVENRRIIGSQFSFLNNGVSSLNSEKKPFFPKKISGTITHHTIQ